MDDQTGKILSQVGKEIAKEAYNDGAKPILEPTGKTLGLIPRAIKSAFLPLEKWIVGREYNLEKTKKLLEIKLKNVEPNLIEQPEPYIAVPAIQYISYCQNSEELRNMYANLLANSMNTIVKNEVHPGFLEIIKQLSPDEAKILKVLYGVKEIPIIGMNYKKEGNGKIIIVEKFSNIGETSMCEKPMEIEKYLDNLERLGLINLTKEIFFVDENKYKVLKEHFKIVKSQKIPIELRTKGYVECQIEKGICRLTKYGISFCEICIKE